MRRGLRRKIAFLGSAVSAAMPVYGFAQTATWTYAPPSAWTATWNDMTVIKPWSPNTTFPNSSTAIAAFPGNGISSGSGTVVLNNLSVTVGLVNIYGNGTNTLANAGTGYTFQGSGASAGIIINPDGASGGGTIDVGYSGRIAGVTQVGVATISVPLKTSSGTFYKTGKGTLVLSAANSFGGGAMSINDGVVKVTQTSAMTGLQIVTTANTGQLELHNASNAGTLTFAGLGSSQPQPDGVIYSSAGNNSWNGAWFIVQAASVGVAAGSTLNLNGPLIDGANTGINGLTKLGAGTFITRSFALSGPLTVQSGTLRIAPFNFGGGATGNLTIAGGASPAAKLDITNNNFVVLNGNLTVIADQVAAARAGGAWTGNGITSSTAAADVIAGNNHTGVGYARGDQLSTWNGTSASFAGKSLSANDVAMMYTQTGDTNLDGIVDANDDFDNFVTGLESSNPLGGLIVPASISLGIDWAHGDFNFDGTIDVDLDFGLFVSGYDAQGNSLNALRSAIIATDLDPTVKQAMLAEVPEPAGPALMLLAGAMAGIRRRRNRPG